MPKGGGRRGGISKGAMQRAIRRADKDERRTRKWQQQQREQQVRGLGQAAASQTFGWNFGKGQSGGSEGKFTPPVHGDMEGYGPVTASFGYGSAEGEALIADGHVDSRSQFDGHPGRRGHDHYQGDGGGAPNRGKYSGPGA